MKAIIVRDDIFNDTAEGVYLPNHSEVYLNVSVSCRIILVWCIIVKTILVTCCDACDVNNTRLSNLLCVYNPFISQKTITQQTQYIHLYNINCVYIYICVYVEIYSKNVRYTCCQTVDCVCVSVWVSVWRMRNAYTYTHRTLIHSLANNWFKWTYCQCRIHNKSAVFLYQLFLAPKKKQFCALLRNTEILSYEMCDTEKHCTGTLSLSHKSNNTIYFMHNFYRPI